MKTINLDYLKQFGEGLKEVSKLICETPPEVFFIMHLPVYGSLIAHHGGKLNASKINAFKTIIPHLKVVLISPSGGGKTPLLDCIINTLEDEYDNLKLQDYLYLENPHKLVSKLKGHNPPKTIFIASEFPNISTIKDKYQKHEYNNMSVISTTYPHRYKENIDSFKDWLVVEKDNFWYALARKDEDIVKNYLNYRSLISNINLESVKEEYELSENAIDRLEEWVNKELTIKGDDNKYFALINCLKISHILAVILPYLQGENTQTTIQEDIIGHAIEIMNYCLMPKKLN